MTTSVFFIFCVIIGDFLRLAPAFENKYCQLPCDFVIKNVTHTICDRNEEKCGPGLNCGPDFKIVKLNDDDRQYILDIHNYLRNKVALGYEKNGAQPTASNMAAMSYNKELEYIAQCWANTCNGNPLIHDVCRRTAKHEHVGQNLGFITSSYSKIGIVKSIKELILLWYNEVELFNSTWINDTQDRGIKVGHYTQMVWADTYEVGCAVSFYSAEGADRKWHNIVFVCNYGPGGNYLGRPLYKTGKPCSRCPKGLKQNVKYKGLCGRAKRLNETDPYGDYEIFNREKTKLKTKEGRNE